MIVAEDFNKDNNKIDHKIYLIDWLDNDFDTYYNDLAKLKQDLYHGWSSRNLHKSQKFLAPFMVNLYESIGR